MSTEPGSTIPEPPIPVCPHCGADLRAINGFPYMLGSFTVLSVACSECRRLLHMQIFQNPSQGESNEPRMYFPS
jgi:hypothetical protein